MLLHKNVIISNNVPAPETMLFYHVEFLFYHVEFYQGVQMLKHTILFMYCIITASRHVTYHATIHLTEGKGCSLLLYMFSRA